MATSKPISFQAQAFITATGAGAVALYFVGVTRAESPKSPALLIALLVAAILASAAKLRLPGINGTMSVGFLVVLVCVAKVSLIEAMTIMASGTIVQCLWNARTTPRLVQVLFSVFNSIMATGVSHMVGSKLLLLFGGSMVVQLMGATICYFFLISFPIAAIVHLTEGRPLIHTWKETYVWSFPYFILGTALVGTLIYLQETVGWQALVFIVPLIVGVYLVYGVYIGRLEAEKKQVEEMATLHLRTIESLALAIETKDPNTQEHLRRVEVFAVEIAKALQLSEPDIQAVRAAALLHDIGKLAVPEHIISKPGRLTPMEFERMKIHPVVGAEILAPVGFPYPVVPIVRSHHERWDGAGYPDGLSEETIPIGARILAVVDALDSLCSDRPYRDAISLDEAVKKIVSEAGKAFDPRITGVLSRHYQSFEALTRAIEPRMKAEPAPGKNSSGQPAGNPTAGISGVQGASGIARSGVFDYRSLIAEARQEAQILFELTRDLGTSLSLEDTLSVLASRLKKVIPHDAIAVFLLRDNVLVPEHVSGENANMLASLQVPLGEGLSGWVAEQRKPMLNGNPAVEAGYLNDPTHFTTLRAAISMPLEGVNSLIGVLTLYRIEKDSFNSDHLRILQATSNKIALSIENALRFRQVSTTAVTDALTSLPNARSLFLQLESELGHARSGGHSLAVIVSDLDGFKSVNDRFGHLEGNRVLREVAEALKHQCRGSDYVARMGGDEFVILLPNCPQATLELRIQKMRDACIEVGVKLFGERIIDASFGVAQYPVDADDAESLLAVADRRMYQVKDQHHGQPTPDGTAVMDPVEGLDAMRRALL